MQKVELREVWESENTDFTPWLAREENIEILGQTIGLDLEAEAQEKNVGKFRADILCKDINTDNWVLIENQLEKTNHGHLGQLLTYATGLDAVTIVWIAATFNEEHKATLEWLNKITNEIKLSKRIHSHVLFSPSAASFDKFKNFEDSGRYFNYLIKKKNFIKKINA